MFIVDIRHCYFEFTSSLGQTEDSKAEDSDIGGITSLSLMIYSWLLG
jgi:hypothetical protein